MSILNSQNSKHILHVYDESKLPQTSTWYSIYHQWINPTYIPHSKIELLIKNFWKAKLFLRGYIRQSFGDTAIPMQIQSLILLFDSVLFNTQIDIDILDKLTELFSFQCVGTDALQCISRIFDKKQHSQIVNGITAKLFENLSHKTVYDIICDKENKQITETLHIMAQILTISPQRSFKVVQENDGINIIQNIIKKMKSAATVMSFTEDISDNKAFKHTYSDTDIVMSDEQNWGTHVMTNVMGKTPQISDKTSHMISKYINIGLQFEIANILLLIAKHCNDTNIKQTYITDVVEWLEWFTQNISSPQCQQILQSDRAILKLYQMTRFEHNKIQYYATKLLITNGTESNEELRLFKNVLPSDRCESNVSFALYPVFDPMSVCIEQCLSENSTQISQSLRFIHGLKDRLIGCNNGVMERIVELISNDTHTYDMALRAQAAITMLCFDMKDVFNTVMRFLVRLFADTLCKLKIIKKSNNAGIGQQTNDINIEVIYNGGFVDIIDISIIDLIGYFGQYFDCSMSYHTLDFIEFMLSISILDIWCLPQIWQKFINSKFKPKLRKCYLSNNTEIKEKASKTFVHFVNNVAVMGICDLCPIAIKPSIDLLSSDDRSNQQIALESMSKLFIGQPLNVYMALKYNIMQYLIPIIVTNMNHRNENKILNTAINVLLHLSEPNIDRKHLPQILDGLSIAMNVNSYASLEMLCRIYSNFTHPNYSKINTNVIEYILYSATHYHKYDMDLVHGFIRKSISNTDIPNGIINCCLSFARLYGNVLQFLVNALNSYYDASTAICNVMNGGTDDNIIDSILDSMDGCEKLIKFIETMPCRNATLIVMNMTESPLHLQRLVPQIIPSLTGLLSQSNKCDILQNVMWTIGNIASHSIPYRDMLLQSFLLNYLVNVMGKTFVKKDEQDKITNAMTWILTHIVSKETAFDHKYLAPILKILSIGLVQTKDTTILEDMCWICSDLTEQFRMNTLIDTDKLVQTYNDSQNGLLVTGYLRRIDCDIHIIPNDVVTQMLCFNKAFNVAIESNPFGAMVQLLKARTDVRNVALKVIGNVVASGIEGTQYLINKQLLPHLIHTIRYASNNETVLNEIYWILSNICAGSSAQIQLVLRTNIFELLVDVLLEKETKSACFENKKHAFYAISNAMHNGTPMQIALLIRKNITFAILEFMKCVLSSNTTNDVKLMIVIVSTIEKILFSSDHELAKELIQICHIAQVLNGNGASSESQLFQTRYMRQSDTIRQSVHRILKLSSAINEDNVVV